MWPRLRFGIPLPLLGLQVLSANQHRWENFDFAFKLNLLLAYSICFGNWVALGYFYLCSYLSLDTKPVLAQDLPELNKKPFSTGHCDIVEKGSWVPSFQREASSFWHTWKAVNAEGLGIPLPKHFPNNTWSNSESVLSLTTFLRRHEVIQKIVTPWTTVTVLATGLVAVIVTSVSLFIQTLSGMTWHHPKTTIH